MNKQKWKICLVTAHLVCTSIEWWCWKAAAAAAAWAAAAAAATPAAAGPGPPPAEVLELSLLRQGVEVMEPRPEPWENDRLEPTPGHQKER